MSTSSRTFSFLGPNIASLDVRMNGFEVIREIKTIDPGIKIVLMTGYGDSDTRTEAIECGACQYITKPFLKKDIKVILEQVA